MDCLCFKANTNEATQLKVSTFGLSGVDDSWMNSIEYFCILNDEKCLGVDDLRMALFNLPTF
jgi:hypothetical protein